jgi:Periplasmic component of the Tol biopolymer transport system
MKKSIFLSCCLVFLVAHIAFCFNHPEIIWRSVVTDHFIIHYYDKTEAAVYPAWKIAEEQYAALSDLYNYTPRDKINLALADYDDYSNGFAGWTNGSIMIWTIDLRFDLRDNNTWLRNVITHELSHIMTLEKESRPQLLDWTFSLSYQSPHSTIALMEPCATNIFWPEWFAEGIAQRESNRAGNDCWDSRRDMILRDALLFSKPLSLEEMGHFNHNGVGNEMVYNQGFSFITFLENKLGRERIKELFNDGRRTNFFPQNFYSYFQDRTGQSITQLYGEWIDSSSQAFKRRVPAAPTPTKTLWDRGTYNSMPKSTRDGRFIGWLTNDKDDFDRTDLLVAPSGALENFVRIPYAQQSWDFSPDGRKVYYIKAHWPNENGSFLNDIFVMDLDGRNETRLTRNARVYDLAVSPDNTYLAWVQYRDGIFSLVKSDCSGRGPATVIQGEMGKPFIGLSFDPNDPAKLVTTRLVNGKAQLFIVDMAQNSISQLSTTRAQEETPYWAANGRIFFSADYDGIFNIYSIKPDKTDCLRYTNTATGLFSPYLTGGGHMLCSEYRGRGFKIVSLDTLSGAAYQAPDSVVRCSFQELPLPKGKVSIRSSPYQPKLLRPVWELQTGASVIDRYGKLEDMQNQAAFNNFADSTAYDINAGIFMSQSDALEKRGKWMGLQVAVEWQGDTARNDSSGQNIALLPRERIRPRSGELSLPEVKNVHRKYNFLSDETIKADLGAYSDYKKSFRTASAASGDSSPQITPYLIPGIGWSTTEHTISLGLDIQAVLVSGLIPGIIGMSGTSQWQISRDVHAGFAPQVQFYTESLLAGHFIAMTDLPFSLLWSFYGYENTDMQYNMSDETMLQATFDPSFFPIIKTSDIDTIIEDASAITCGIECAHGFPLTRYSSLVVSAAGYYSTYSDSVNDPQDALKGMSTDYTTGYLAAALEFPLARQINKGRRYADALYGELLYEVSLYANRDLTASALRKSLTSAPRSFADSGSVAVSHYIGAGIHMGFVKSYTFSQMLTLQVLWDIWAKSMHLNISFSL